MQCGQHPGREVTMTVDDTTMGRERTTWISVAVLVLAAMAAPADLHAETSPLPQPGAEHASGTPQWVRIDTRDVTSQLLRYSFDLTNYSGHFRAFRIESDRGTVEIARAEITFEGGEPLIDNAFTVLKPDSHGRSIRLDGSRRPVARVSLISNTTGRSGRMTLHALFVPDIIVPPPPQRSNETATRAATR